MAESADRDGNRALRDRLAQVHERYARLRSDMDEMQRRLSEMRVLAVSPDGLVRATVGPRGQLIDLWIDRRASRSIDSDQLARIIVATVQDAAARTAKEVEAMMADYFPADSGALGFVRDNDFSTLMRRPDAMFRDLTERDSLNPNE
ncbi:MAG: YbaB/EbfC family nucleoid-associated protein [Actinoplanes sp.]